MALTTPVTFLLLLSRAHEVLQRAFPDRRVVSVPTREVLLGGGNIHCITTQQPSPLADRPPDFS